MLHHTLLDTLIRTILEVPGGAGGTGPTLEATQGQNDSFFSQLPYKCYLEEVASVGDLT